MFSFKKCFQTFKDFLKIKTAHQQSWLYKQVGGGGQCQILNTHDLDYLMSQREFK